MERGRPGRDYKVYLSVCVCMCVCARELHMTINLDTLAELFCICT